MFVIFGDFYENNPVIPAFVSLLNRLELTSPFVKALIVYFESI